MNIKRTKIIFSNCNNCNKRMDNELVNVIELNMINRIIICDDCLNGLNKIITKSILDKKSHTYVNENNTVY